MVLTDQLARASCLSRVSSTWWPLTSFGKNAMTGCSIWLIHVLLHAPHTTLALVSRDLPGRE